jgi:hypothetical protein
LPQGIITPSFIEIALAVTKTALLTDDDDDGCQVIAIAHQKGELKMPFFKSTHLKMTSQAILLKPMHDLYLYDILLSGAE